MKKAFVFLLIAMTCVGAFANGAKEAPSGLPEITFYHGWFQDDWQPAIEMRAMYEEFAQAHKDEFIFNAIALDTGNQGVYDKCIQEIALGRFPDIVDLAGMNAIPAASAANLIVDLKPYIDADPEFKKGIGVNYEQNEIDGKIYTVRDQLETIGFWYNEDLFKKANAPLPETWKAWEDFDKAVDALIKSPAVATPFSMNQDWPTTIILSGYLLGSEGGRKMANSVPTTFDTPAFRQALDFLRNSVLGKVTNEYFTAADSERYREDFFNGKSAMLFNGVWESGSFTGDMAIDPSVIKPAVFPTQESGKTAAIVSASPGFAISNKLDKAKLDACIEFVKYMTSEATAAKIFEKAQAMPPSTSIDYDKYINGNYDAAVKGLAAACKAAMSADYQAKTAGATWGEDITGTIAGKYASIQTKTKTTDQIIKELNSVL